jgi:hypothetical protein
MVSGYLEQSKGQKETKEAGRGCDEACKRPKLDAFLSPHDSLGSHGALPQAETKHPKDASHHRASVVLSGNLARAYQRFPPVALTLMLLDLALALI